MNIKEIYNSFLDSGELVEFLPSATGVWEEDAAAFKKLYHDVYEPIINEVPDLVDEDEVDDF